MLHFIIKYLKLFFAIRGHLTSGQDNIAYELDYQGSIAFLFQPLIFRESLCMDYSRSVCVLLLQNPMWKS